MITKSIRIVGIKKYERVPWTIDVADEYGEVSHLDLSPAEARAFLRMVGIDVDAFDKVVPMTIGGAE